MGARLQASVYGPGAVLVDRGRISAGLRRVVGVFSTFGNGSAVNEGHFLVEQGKVPGYVQIVRAGKGQPQQVITEVCPHPFAARRMPPVLHVTLYKLPRGIDQYLLAQLLRRNDSKGHAVLQLIPESERTTSLIKASL